MSQGSDGLQTSLTLAMRNSSYSDFCKVLAAKTSIPFTVDGRLADRKITVFCDAKPAKEVMDVAGSALGIDFERTKDGMRLTQTAEQRKREDDQTRIDARNEIQRLSDTLELLNLVSEALPANVAKLKLGIWPGDSEGFKVPDRLKKRFTADDLRAIMVDNVFPSCGVVGRSDPAGLAKRLQSTGQYAYSTVRGDGLPTVEEKFGSLSGPVDDLRPEPTRFITEYDSVAARMIVTTYTHATDGDKDDLFGWPHYLRVSPNPQIEESGPLDKEETTYAEPLAQTALAQDTAPLSGQGLVGAVDLAEHARYLSEALHIPVVADGSRLVISEPWPKAPATLRAYIERIQKPAEKAPFAHVAGAKFVHGWLALRPSHWWRNLAWEIPERLLRRMEAAYESGKGPNLDDYAHFATELTPAQLDGLSIIMKARPQLVLGFPIAPFNNNAAGPFLALYGSLGNSQLGAVKAGIPFADLTPPQRSLVAAAMAVRLKLTPTIPTFLALYGKTAPDLSSWGLQASSGPPERPSHTPDLEATIWIKDSGSPFHWGDEVLMKLGPSDGPMMVRFPLRLKGLG